jgi:hypothetical protein
MKRKRGALTDESQASNTQILGMDDLFLEGNSMMGKIQPERLD